MNWNRIKWAIRYYWQYFPFTLNTLICALAAWGAYKILYKPMPKGVEPSAFLPFIIIMGKMAFLFIVALTALSILSTFATYFYFIWLHNSKGSKLQVSFSADERAPGKQKLYLHTRLDGAIRPLLGFVTGRLYYDDNKMTPIFGLLSGKRKEQSIWRTAITGKSRFSLPDIKEYDLKGGFVYFQDMLHIFSLAVSQPATGHFYQPPVLLEGQDAEVSPRKTESMDVRIDQLRRTEGEYLNYKDFESGDDVRRIVWKVYARNRELVVRIPELFEPFASHLYFYASFHAPVKTAWLADDYLKEMLNYYKNSIWTIYDTLGQKEWELRYVPDQPYSTPEQLPAPDLAARTISHSQWHNGAPLPGYFNARNGSVLCISSFTDPQELQETLERCDAATVVYLVKVSQVFRQIVPLTILSRLILQPPQDRLSRLRSSWLFSPMRLQVQKREKELETILQKSHVVTGVI